MSKLNDFEPWCVLLGSAEMGVAFKTSWPAAGLVYWRQKEDEEWRLALGEAENGLLCANSTVQKVVLKNYCPELPLYFLPAAKPIAHFGPYEVQFQEEVRGREYSLRPVLKKGSLRMAVICDLHNQSELLEDALGKEISEYTLCVFNGDTCDAPNGREDLENNLCYPLAKMTALGLASIFVRGNHECRGAGARLMPEYLPGFQGYYKAFTLGPVRLFFLDTGEDKPKDHEEYSGLIDFSEYLKKEAEWLQTEVISLYSHAVKWRLVFMHIPPRPFPGTKPYPLAEPGFKYFAPVLNGKGVDLVVSGHEHQAAFWDREKMAPYGLDFPLVLGGGGWHHPERLKALDILLSEDRFSLKNYNFSAKKRKI